MKHRFLRGFGLAALALVALAFLLAAPITQAQGPQGLQVHFPALTTPDGIKAGDCAVVITPDGLVMVIDAGAPTASPSLLEALDALGIARVDMLVASHPHIDHVGGMPSILGKYPVGQALMSPLAYDSGPNTAFLRAAQRRQVPITHLRRGDRFPLGEEVTVEVLWPQEPIQYYPGYPDKATQFINNHSLVLRLRYGQFTALFAGDLYVQGERAVAEAEDVSAQLVKVNHHGDKTSSSKTWRAATAAQVAVVTHNAIADLQVLRKYQREGTQLYHTFLDGMVSVYADPQGRLTVETQTPRTGDFP